MDLSNKTFLVTGGAGFIGSALVKELLKYDVKKVVIFDNFSRGKNSLRRIIHWVRQQR